MKGNYSRQTEKHIYDIATTKSEQFDSVIISNTVEEQIPESNPLIETIEAAEQCETAMLVVEENEDDRSALVEFDHAKETLNDLVEERAERAVTDILQTLYDMIDEYTDTWDESDVNEAKKELEERIEVN